MIKKGLMFGLIMGFVVSLFDGLLMLVPNVSIPYAHIWFVLMFNLCFWMIFGSIIAIFLQLYFYYKKSIIQFESFYWACFFLIPFAFVYGFLGSLPLRDAPRISYAPFDNYASFLWVMVVFLFLFFFKKKVNKTKLRPISYLPEIVIIVSLFQFCFNLKNLIIWTKPFEELKLHLNNKFILALYGFGVLLILCVYLISFFKLDILNRKPRWALTGLVLTVVLLLNGLFLANQVNLTKNELRPIGVKNQVSPKVSNVILIVLDTVRANRLSVYAPLNTTKSLESFSKDAVVYENCIAPSSWTLPSHASLFTGLYPVEHGKQHSAHNREFLSRSDFTKFTTLADIFKDNNYHTVGIVSNATVVNSFTNLDKGFQVFDTLHGLAALNGLPFLPLYNHFVKLTNINAAYLSYYRPAEQINKIVFENLEESPFFMFINYMDAHRPYNPPRPFNGYFADQKFPQLFKIRQYLGCTFFECPDDEAVNLFKKSQYDGELAYLDHHLGEFFLELKRKDIYDSSLIIVTSDHGEFLGEHEFYGHTGNILLYNEVIKVPLIIKFPNNSNIGRDKKLITLSDVYSTILSVCDMPVPDYVSGKAFGQDVTPVVSELKTNKNGRQRTIYFGNYKYLEFEKKREAELYALKADVAEKNNLAGELPEVAALMKNRLEKWQQEHKPKYKIINSSKKEMPKEMLDGLKALGYIQ